MVVEPKNAADSSDRKRVAVIVPGGVGGPYSGKYIPALVGLLNGLGRQFDLTVYSLTDIGDREQALRERCFAIRAVRGGPGNSLLLRSLGVLRKFFQDHLRKRFDIVHGIWAIPSGLLAVVTGKICRIPVVVGLHGGETADLPEFEYGGMRTGRLKKMTVWTCRRADKLICLTRFQKTDLQKNGVDRDVAVIPLGADRNLFRPGPRASKKKPGRPVHFLHVANLTAIKDQETLLRTFSLLRRDRDCRLRIVGPDYFDGHIQSLCRELTLGEDVSFTGFVDHRDLAVHYQWADCLLHTSRYEGQGLAIAEAAVCGVLVAGTRVGLLADLGDQRAVTVTVGDFKGLARAVLDVLDDPNRFCSIREAARIWSESHGIEVTVGRYTRLYRLCP